MDTDELLGIDPKELQIDIFRPPNSGVNSYSTGIRITHKPTGKSVTAYEMKTIAANRKTAMTKLYKLLNATRP